MWESAVRDPAKCVGRPIPARAFHDVLQAAVLMACRNLLLNPGPCTEAAVRLALRRLQEHGGRLDT